MRNNNVLIILLFICLAGAAPRATAQSVVDGHSILSQGTWYKMPITSDGIYKITTADLPALNGTPCNQLAIYGGTGTQLSELRNTNQPDGLSPVAIQVVDNDADGTFDPGDYILFYAECANVWRYVSDDSRFEYHVNPYATYNCYYLTTSYSLASASTQVSTSTLSPTNSTPITNYTAVAVRNIDKLNTHGGGQIWVEEKLSAGNATRNYTLTLPDIPVDRTALARYGLGHTPDYSGQFSVRCGNNSTTMPFNYSLTYRQTLQELSNLGSRELTFNLTYSPSTSNSEGYMDYIEVNAQVPLTYSGSQMVVRNTSQIGNNAAATFQVTGNSSNVQVWDITQPLQPTQLPINTVNSSLFQFVASCQTPGTFILFSPSDALTPQSITALSNQDIQGSTTPDYVIVTHKDFLQQANRLADLHHTLDGLNVLVLTQEEVFNEFSSGKPDPIAMRQMMMRLRQNDSQGTNPRYLLYFGKGTYDNRDIMGKGTRSVVTYQTYTSFETEGTSYPSDDVAGYIDTLATGLFEGQMSVGIGRLPANTLAEATHFVDKIERYMTRADFEDPNVRGDWRNYVALLADDADPSCPYDSVFASDSEKTARLIKQQYPQFNIDKIYADSYIQQSGADGSYYPDVNNALRQRMNYGCLLLNYIGHGSSSYIGTERYVEFSDVENYTNTNQLPLFVTSTCSYGHYDLPGDICGAEAFLLAPAAGIGVIAAARPIHHSQPFNTNVCLAALNPNNTIGDALRIGKNATQVSHCINLMGDPALHLSLPRNQVVVTSINDRAVQDSVTDSAEVLSRVTIEGEIRNADGSLLTDFNGTIYPIVFDREVACQTLANDNDSTEVSFVQQKSMLYKGRENVQNGRFSYSFIIPRDVAYRYDYAKLSHYAQSQSDNATGEYSNIMFGGFNEEMEIAELHPTVELYIGDTRFRNGSITNETPTLYARLLDSVGINAAGSGLGHDITAVIDDNPYSTVILNDYYQPDINDSRNGEVLYTLGKLEDGPHTLTVKCWNIFNYSGSQTINFVVANDRNPQIGQLTAAPNPAHDRTTIRLEHNMPEAVANAVVQIFDTRGRLIREFTPEAATGNCLITIPWDYTTESGMQVPQGIYILRAIVTTLNDEQLLQTAKIVRN